MLHYGRDGATVVENLASVEDIEGLRDEFSSLDFKAGARPFSLSPLVKRLLSVEGSFGRAKACLGLSAARAVRVLAFDKTPAQNWSLGWHQDRVIAVKERHDIPGFGTWTKKGGTPHVEAPVEILEQMFSLRFHLDDCEEDNGALKILPGSFKKGKLSDQEVHALASFCSPMICSAKTGDILAMKALTVHASEASKQPSHRRVLHIDYCLCELPSGLAWALDQTG